MNGRRISVSVATIELRAGRRRHRLHAHRAGRLSGRAGQLGAAQAGHRGPDGRPRPSPSKRPSRFARPRFARRWRSPRPYCGSARSTIASQRGRHLGGPLQDQHVPGAREDGQLGAGQRRRRSTRAHGGGVSRSRSPTSTAAGTSPSRPSVSSRCCAPIEARKPPIDRSDVRPTRASSPQGVVLVLVAEEQPAQGRAQRRQQRPVRPPGAGAGQHAGAESSRRPASARPAAAAGRTGCAWCPRRWSRRTAARRPGRRTRPGGACAYSMIVMPPIECPASTTGPVGASRRSTSARSSPSWPSVADRQPGGAGPAVPARVVRDDPRRRRPSAAQRRRSGGARCAGPGTSRAAGPR